MASNVYQLLLDKLNQEMQVVSDAGNNWFDSKIAQLQNDINTSSLDSNSKTLSIKAINTLISNKSTLIDLGQYGLSLFLFQIGLGKTSDATETYIQALSNPDDLIALMNAGADGVIKAKKNLDQLEANAISLAEELGMDAIKAVLPFIIAMIPI